MDRIDQGGPVRDGLYRVGNGDREHWVPVEGFPEPTRVVEYRGSTLRSRVKVKGYLIDAALGEG